MVGGVVTVEVRGGTGRGPRLVLTSHRAAAGKRCCLVCVFSVKNRPMTVMEQEAGAKDIFTAINATFIHARLVLGRGDLSVNEASPDRQRLFFSSFCRYFHAKKDAFPQRCSTHGDKSNISCGSRSLLIRSSEFCCQAAALPVCSPSSPAAWKPLIEQ